MLERGARCPSALHPPEATYLGATGSEAQIAKLGTFRVCQEKASVNEFSRHCAMAPRVPSHGGIGHTRRVSFLIDLGGGCEEDVSHVRLTVRRLLAHFSRQRPAPRWCVRFYDSGLSPHAFDAKLRARADERATRLAEEEERERERNLNDSRVQSWVDEHTRETAGVSMRRAAATAPSLPASKKKRLKK